MLSAAAGHGQTNGGSIEGGQERAEQFAVGEHFNTIGDSEKFVHWGSTLRSDDEPGRALKLSVVLAHETYELLAERLGLVGGAMSIRVESDRAVKDSTEARREFLIELEAVRRGM